MGMIKVDTEKSPRLTVVSRGDCYLSITITR